MFAQSFPPQPTSFIGRQRELDDIVRLLHDPNCRLLTLVGPGGIGKTRLAIETAANLIDDFADGAFFVSLAPLRATEDTITAIAAAVGCHAGQGTESPEHQLLTYLRPKAMLLVLDNVEHLLNVAPLVGRALNAAPHVKILATSREVLRLQHEWVRDVEGMDVPTNDQIDDCTAYSALALFVDRARRLQENFQFVDHCAAIARICRYVEGMPLALELAASWLRVMSCDEIAHELEQGLDLLETTLRDLPARHRSMRATLDHSWNLLSEVEQTTLKQLAVFRGGFTREAAGVVAKASTSLLLTLVDKSLLQRDESGRYTLHELTRQYAKEHLFATPGLREAARYRHSTYYLTWIAERYEGLRGTHREVFREVEREIDNLRSAWAWAVEKDNVAELMQAIDSVGMFFDHRGLYLEGAHVLAHAAEVIHSQDALENRNALLGQVLKWQGAFQNWLLRPDEAQQTLSQSVALLHEAGALKDEIEALHFLGQTFRARRLLDRAVQCYEQSLGLARASNDRYGIAHVLLDLGSMSIAANDDEAIVRHATESLRLCRELDMRWGIVGSLSWLSSAALRRSAYEEAEHYINEASTVCQQVDLSWISGTVFNIQAEIAYARGRVRDVHYYVFRVLKIAEEMGLNTFLGSLEACLTLMIFAKLLCDQNQFARSLEIHSLAMIHEPTQSWQWGDYEPCAARISDTLSPDEYETAITRGRNLDPGEVVRGLITELAATLDTYVPPQEQSLDALTPRELEVLTLIAKGHSNRDIADELVLSVGTVKWYAHTIMQKLQAKNRTHAVTRARELELIAEHT